MSHFPGKLLPPEQEPSLVRAAVINTAGLQPQLRAGPVCKSLWCIYSPFMPCPSFNLNLLCRSGAKAHLHLASQASLLCLQSSGVTEAACPPKGLHHSPSSCLQAGVSARGVRAVWF